MRFFSRSAPFSFPPNSPGTPPSSIAPTPSTPSPRCMEWGLAIATFLGNVWVNCLCRLPPPPHRFPSSLICVKTRLFDNDNEASNLHRKYDFSPQSLSASFFFFLSTLFLFSFNLSPSFCRPLPYEYLLSGIPAPLPSEGLSPLALRQFLPLLELHANHRVDAKSGLVKPSLPSLCINSRSQFSSVRSPPREHHPDLRDTTRYLPPFSFRREDTSFLLATFRPSPPKHPLFSREPEFRFALFECAVQNLKESTNHLLFHPSLDNRYRSSSSQHISNFHSTFPRRPRGLPIILSLP